MEQAGPTPACYHRVMSAVPERKWNVEEYLAFERQEKIRHELVDGEVVAMSGASRVHGRISWDITLALGPQLDSGADRLGWHLDCAAVGVACRSDTPLEVRGQRLTATGVGRQPNYRPMELRLPQDHVDAVQDLLELPLRDQADALVQLLVVDGENQGDIRHRVAWQARRLC